MDRNKAKQRIAHEITELLIVFLFVAPFFLSFEAYRIYLLHEPGNMLFEYGAALVSALALSKIILTGQLFGLGKRSEHQPLIISTVYKAGMFTLLYILFHVLERTIHGVVHGAPFLGALHGAVARKGEVIARALAVFFAFIPFFALFETRRVMGEVRFLSIFLGRPRQSDPARDPYADAM
ncbi:MAG TPA: hypothetical protein VH640_17745 [Bryobacteraceae bacterium]